MSASSSYVELSWLPLGADATHVVQWSGRAFESAAAAQAHRERRDLYHSALEVTLDEDHYVIEMTPAWVAPTPVTRSWRVGQWGPAR